MKTTLSPGARRFLEEPRFAVVATLNPDGTPLQAVVWYSLDGDAVVFNSRVGRQWPTNIVRDGRVSFIVADGYDYVELRGLVEIDDDPVRGQEVIAGLTRRYHDGDESLEARIAAFASQARVTFTLRPERSFERLPDERR
jgi:PPOX class probable F420-dependent enzyme